MKKKAMKQEVRLRLDVSLTVSASHNRQKLRDILERGIRCAFPNNDKHFHAVEFAEERDIYGADGEGIAWENLAESWK